jgi:probable HAF family extracellular repeat protein
MDAGGPDFSTHIEMGEIMAWSTPRVRTGFALALFGLFAAAPARGAYIYSILDLGAVSGVPGINVINYSGQVVGTLPMAGGTTDAFRTASNGKITLASDLGTLGGNSSAWGINTSGQAVGYSYNTGGPAHAFRTGPNGKITAASDLGSFGDASYARGINDSGQVVGSSSKVGGGMRAYRTGPNGQITAASDLGDLGGGISEALGINALGQAVGDSYLYIIAATHAYRTTPNGKITAASDLGTLDPTNPYASSSAAALNTSGQVVGESEMPGGAIHAYRTAPNGNITASSDLGALGGTNSVAFGINTWGQAVGYSDTAGNAVQHAFFTEPTGPMRDLNSFIDPASGWVLTRASGINDSGQIAGTGTINGQTHAFLISPVPVPLPSSFFMAVVAGLLLLVRNYLPTLVRRIG